MRCPITIAHISSSLTPIFSNYNSHLIPFLFCLFQLSSAPMPVLNNVQQVDADRDDHEKAKLNSQQQNETFENGTMSAL